MNNVNLEQLGKSLERGYVAFDRVSRKNKMINRMKLARIDYLIRRLDYNVSTK